MIPLAGLFFNKFLIGGLVGAGLLGGIYFFGYNQGYDSADLKWKDKNADMIAEAVKSANEAYEKAKEVDNTTISKLRNNRVYYRRLYKESVDFKPTPDCELTDRMLEQFNRGLRGKTDLSN